MKKSFEAVLSEKGRGGIRCVLISNRGSVFTGKAICSTTDDFKMAKGMRIAEIRAKIKQLEKIFCGVCNKRDAFFMKMNQNENRSIKLSHKIWNLRLELNQLCEEDGE